ELLNGLIVRARSEQLLAALEVRPGLGRLRRLVLRRGRGRLPHAPRIEQGGGHGRKIYFTPAPKGRSAPPFFSRGGGGGPPAPSSEARRGPPPHWSSRRRAKGAAFQRQSSPFPTRTANAICGLSAGAKPTNHE